LTDELTERAVIALERIADSLEKSRTKAAPQGKSNCRYCGAEIEWAKYGKKTWPVNPDGSQHHCKEYEEAKKARRAEAR
jgi:hypothetical protein